MLKKIKDTIQKYSMLKKRDRVLVAVSGGPDSTSLLVALNCLKSEFGINLCAAHLNHLLRGAESDKDAQYARNLANRFEIPFFADSRDVLGFARKEKLSIEQAARQIRYEFFKETAKQINANKIALGHNCDDQAETMLMRLFRGSGMRGLRAILPKRKISEKLEVIRPLIEVPRKDIELFLKRKKIKPRIDSTNKKDIYFRNKIRHKLIPYLEKNYFPNLKKQIARTAQTIALDYDYLSKQHTQAFKKIISTNRQGEISFKLNEFKQLPASFQNGIIRLAIEEIKGDLLKIDYRHIEKIKGLIFDKKAASTIQLPGDTAVRRKAGTIRFYKKGDSPQKRGQSPFLPLSFKATVLESPPKKFSPSRRIEYFDAGKIIFPLATRCRKPHDKIRPLGMKRYKRLQDIFIDDKISKAGRDKIPLVVDSKGRIIWVCGVRMSDDFKITPKTTRFLRLELIKE
ncbi:MAG: tRNA lysidine(34) synthetase TilS [Candidatus Omnitrophota bacterium]